MWKPIITDIDKKNRIRLKIEEITETIINEIPQSDSAGLLSGKSGVSLYFAYLNKFREDNIYDELIADLISESFNSINEKVYLPSYCSGIAGILWTLGHLNKHDFLEVDDEFPEINTYLANQMIMYAEKNNFDFFHGSLGIATQLLNANNVTEKESLRQFVTLLKKNRIFDNETGKYNFFSDDGVEEQSCNLGISHGISSAIIFLSKYVESGLATNEDTATLETLVLFLLSQKRTTQKSVSLYPSYAKQSGEWKNSRLAWCFGDMGNAIALYKAAQVLQNKLWEEEAITIMLSCCYRKTYDETLMRDAGLCHGSAGVSLIFNRFYQQTGKEEFKTAAIYWIDRTLEYATYEDGLAGYKKILNNLETENTVSLLEGIAGIGLVLMSSISIIEPKWDKSLLIS